MAGMDFTPTLGSSNPVEFVTALILFLLQLPGRFTLYAKVTQVLPQAELNYEGKMTAV